MSRATSVLRVLRVAAAAAGVAALGACSMAGLPAFKPGSPQRVAALEAKANTAAEPAPFLPLAFAAPGSGRPGMDGLIAKYAAHYEVPESLIRRVIQRESGYNPRARNGPNLGLMQIQYGTARSMGYSGSAAGLFDAETNLRYAVKYLRGAYIVGGRDPDRAVRLYSSGYYYHAKRQGLLDEVGL